MHKEGGNLTCPHCQKTFTEYPDKRKHIEHSHEEERFSCTVCNISFTGSEQLETHLVSHTEAKSFMCDYCGEKCKREDKLGKMETKCTRMVVIFHAHIARRLSQSVLK